MFHLPIDVLSIIYSYDSTYKGIYNVSLMHIRILYRRKAVFKPSTVKGRYVLSTC